MFNGRSDVDYRRAQKPRGARRRDWGGASRGAHGGYGHAPMHHSGHYPTPADPLTHLRALSYTLAVVGTDLLESSRRITAAVQRYLTDFSSAPSKGFNDYQSERGSVDIEVFGLRPTKSRPSEDFADRRTQWTPVEEALVVTQINEFFMNRYQNGDYRAVQMLFQLIDLDRKPALTVYDRERLRFLTECLVTATVLGNTRFLQLVEHCYTTTQMLGTDWLAFLCERIRCSFELDSAVDEALLHFLTKIVDMSTETVDSQPSSPKTTDSGRSTPSESAADTELPSASEPSSLLPPFLLLNAWTYACPQLFNALLVQHVHNEQAFRKLLLLLALTANDEVGTAVQLLCESCEAPHESDASTSTACLVVRSEVLPLIAKIAYALPLSAHSENPWIQSMLALNADAKLHLCLMRVASDMKKESLPLVRTFTSDGIVDLLQHIQLTMSSVTETDTYLYDEKLTRKVLQRVGQLIKLLEALGALTRSPLLVDACRQFGAAATGTFLSAEL